MFFLPPSLIRFWIFSDLKQRNKSKWPNHTVWMLNVLFYNNCYFDDLVSACRADTSDDGRPYASHRPATTYSGCYGLPYQVSIMMMYCIYSTPQMPIVVIRRVRPSVCHF